MITSGAALPATHGSAVWRMTQEVVTNADKHAPGAFVAVELHLQRRYLLLRITNTAASFHRASRDSCPQRPRAATCMTVCVLMVDDQAILGQTPVMLFQGAPDPELVGEAEKGLESAELARTIREDVVVIVAERDPAVVLVPVPGLRPQPAQSF